MRLQTAILIAAIGILSHESTFGLGHFYYSPADSVIYVQYSSGINETPFYLMRLWDGGSRMDEAAVIAPGWVFVTDNIPGHVYCHAGDPNRIYRSTDYGNSWNVIPARPAPAHNLHDGRPGRLQGEATIVELEPVPWIYCTSNSWDTYDSVRFNPTIPGYDDPVQFSRLTYENGILYGIMGVNNIWCISADTGQTWLVGHSLGLFHGVSQVGAPDELWGFSGTAVFMASDTGRTLLDSLLVIHPPEVPDYYWFTDLVATPHPGEAYFLADMDIWTVPSTTRILVYHIQAYGAQVDSFYYVLRGYHMDAAQIQPIPKQFDLMAYPNPFNAATTLAFSLSQTSLVSLTVFNVLGQAVYEADLGMLNAGAHRQMFDASELPSGVYVARVQAGEMSQMRKMVLLR
ncbi:MAG: T9SS type A sorting domain-containing protein [Calditrichota bacterium]